MQSRKSSLCESLAATTIGFIVSVVVWQFVVRPLWNLQTSFAENLGITLLFTVISVIRGYYVRRLFNMLNKNNKNQKHDQPDWNSRPSA